MNFGGTANDPLSISIQPLRIRSRRPNRWKLSCCLMIFGLQPATISYIAIELTEVPPIALCCRPRVSVRFCHSTTSGKSISGVHVVEQSSHCFPWPRGFLQGGAGNGGDLLSPRPPFFLERSVTFVPENLEVRKACSLT